MTICSRSARRVVPPASPSRDRRDKLLNAGLEPHHSDHAHLEAEVTQSPSQIVLDSDGLRQEELAMGHNLDRKIMKRARNNAQVRQFMAARRGLVLSPLFAFLQR